MSGAGRPERVHAGNLTAWIRRWAAPKIDELDRRVAELERKEAGASTADTTN